MPDRDVDDGSGPNVGGAGSGYRSTPIPDPTVLTTQALYREVASLKELIEQRIAALSHETDSEREATRRSLAEAIKSRTIFDREATKRIDLQFELVERQRVEQKKDTKDAVDAALTAQKEAVKEQTTASERAIAKSETSTNKQLEQLGISFKTETDSLRRSIDEVKERIGEVATTANAYGQQRQGGVDSRAVIGWGIAAIASLIAIGVAIVSALKP